MIVYLVQMYKFGSEFANEEECDLFKIFDEESKCFEVFNNKNYYDWQVALVGAFDTSTGCGVQGSLYCLVNDGDKPRKMRLAACVGYFK